jgi:hypothetical protein
MILFGIVPHFFVKLLRKLLRDNFILRKQWYVACMSSDSDFFQIYKFSYGSADPFILCQPFSHEIYFEKILKNGFGILSKFKIETSEKIPSSILCNESSTHKSFPFVFEDCGRFWLIPESNTDEDVKLYCKTDDNKYVYFKTLLEGDKWVDPIFLNYNSEKYLIVNRKFQNRGKLILKLEIYYFTDFPNGPLVEVPLVISENIAQRNGGLIKLKENYFRISQISTLNQYGIGFSLNKILTVSPDLYSEVSIDQCVLYFPIHHLSRCPHFIVCDMQLNLLNRFFQKNKLKKSIQYIDAMLLRLNNQIER